MGNNDFSAVSGSPADVAIHAEHGRCTVLVRLGHDCLIEVEHRYPDDMPKTDDLPLGVEPHEVLTSETICTQMLVVPTASLEFRTRTGGSATDALAGRALRLGFHPQGAGFPLDSP